MVQAASTSITPNALRVLDMRAELNEAGEIEVEWETEVKADDVQWLVVYYMKGSSAMRSVEQTNETAVTLSGLIPNSTYVIEIQEATGKQVGGETTKAEVTIPAAEAFDDYGFTKGYVSIWLRPNKDVWTVNNLAKTRTTFSKDEKIAFALETISTVKKSEDVVNILLVVRNEDGVVVDRYNGEEIWNDMWTKKKYVGELLRTPQEPGQYTLEIYFNGDVVKTGKAIVFNIE